MRILQGEAARRGRGCDWAGSAGGSVQVGEGGSYGLPTAASADEGTWPSGCVGGVKTAQTDSPICVRFRAIAQYALDRHSMAGRPAVPVEAAASGRPYRAEVKPEDSVSALVTRRRLGGTRTAPAPLPETCSASSMTGAASRRAGLPFSYKPADKASAAETPAPSTAPPPGLPPRSECRSSPDPSPSARTRW